MASCNRLTTPRSSSRRSCVANIHWLKADPRAMLASRFSTVRALTLRAFWSSVCRLQWQNSWYSLKFFHFEMAPSVDLSFCPRERRR